MSNIADEISYLVGRKKEKWPNRIVKEPSDTAKLIRQVYPDRL